MFLVVICIVFINIFCTAFNRYMQLYYRHVAADVFGIARQIIFIAIDYLKKAPSRPQSAAPKIKVIG
jgi:hypothetical protein